MRVIDADLHNGPPTLDDLRPYLDARWHGSVDAARDTSYPADTPRIADVKALDLGDADTAILCCTFGPSSVPDPDAAAALATACNDWQTAEWLEKDDRLRASIVVDVKQPLAAAREIDRAARDRRFVQVLMPVRSEMLYGNREYHPIYEAAVRNGLAVGIHFGGAASIGPTSSGSPSYYVEEYVGMSQIFESQIMNLIAEGVFDRFPDLRIAIVESGWAWVPAWMWRMDKEWKGLRREIPWVRDAPADYIRRHMRFTLQPIDTPSTREMLQIVEQMGSDELIMYSSDRPHAHFRELPDGLPGALREKVLHANATAFYRL
jgi:predicted TIM-barrel fold metal-dependent hydrolase